MPDLSAIRTRVQANWPTNYHSTELTDAKTDQFINDDLRKVCRLYNFTFMKQEVTQNTTDGQQKYALPTASDSNWSEVESGTVRKFKAEISCELINEDSYRKPLTKVFKDTMENKTDFVDTAAAGTPTYYVMSQGYLWLYKKPDHSVNNNTAFVINLEFYGYLADMSADSDTNAVTDDYSEVLEYGATAAGFRFGMDVDLAEYWEGKFNEVLAEMMREDQIREYGILEEGMIPLEGQSLGD